MGVIASSSGVIVTLRTQMSGVQMENSFLYYNTDPTAQILPNVARDYFVDTVIPDWQAVVCTSCQFIQLKVETSAPAPFTPYPPIYASLAGTAGLVSGEPMPPYAAIALVKYPDVANQDIPAPPTPWRNGSTRIGGIGEAVNVNGGYLNPTFGTAVQNLANDLLQFVGGGDIMQLYMRRFIPGDAQPDFFVPVAGVEYNSVLSTQNTRKINR